MGFVLKERREELKELCKRRDFNAESILAEIENQDMEFIQILKEEFRTNTNYEMRIINEIVNKLTGFTGEAN